jgi:hypothetical protein
MRSIVDRNVIRRRMAVCMYTYYVSVYHCVSYCYRLYNKFSSETYRGADKSLARPTSRCVLFEGENISFDASLVIYIQGVTGGTDQTSGGCSLC